MSRGRTAEEMSGSALLVELTDVAAKIGIELRNQYLLAYSPKNATRDGKRVQVKLVETTRLPQLRAMFRMGYYAPTQ